MDKRESDPFGFDEIGDAEAAEAQPQSEQHLDLLGTINMNTGDTAGEAVQLHAERPSSTACHICGTDLPGSYTLNAFLYNPGGDNTRRGELTLPYCCFVCGKTLCPECAVRAGFTLGALLICSDECSAKLCVVDGIRSLLDLSVADDNRTEAYEGEHIQPFWWSQQCRVCGRVHGDDEECEV